MLKARCVLHNPTKHLPGHSESESLFVISNKIHEGFDTSLLEIKKAHSIECCSISIVSVYVYWLSDCSR